MSVTDKPLVWFHSEVASPPFSDEARREAGFLLRRLQRGEALRMPQARRMATIGARCWELRINDAGHTWRIIYRVDPDAIVIVEVFDKDSAQTPQSVIDTCKTRLRRYDADSGG